MSTGFKSAEETVRDLKFGETVADGNGNKYTKTIGGWIYQTFSGQVCFVPEGTTEKSPEVIAVRKNRTTEK